MSKEANSTTSMSGDCLNANWNGYEIITNFNIVISAKVGGSSMEKYFECNDLSASYLCNF